MNTASGNWKDLYAAALFEDDRMKAAALVTEAESAMIMRAKALFTSSGNDRKEVVELDQSLRMLRLLKTCLTGEMESRPAA
jgi:hypothetical protein